MNAPYSPSVRRQRHSGFPYRPGDLDMRRLKLTQGETGIAGVSWVRSHLQGYLVLGSLEPKPARKLWQLIKEHDPAQARTLTEAKTVSDQLAGQFGSVETLLALNHPAVVALRQHYENNGVPLRIITRMSQK